MPYREFMAANDEVRLRKEKVFLELAERFRAADDFEEVTQLGDGLGRFIFGE